MFKITRNKKQRRWIQYAANYIVALTCLSVSIAEAGSYWVNEILYQTDFVDDSAVKTQHASWRLSGDWQNVMS